VPKGHIEFHVEGSLEATAEACVAAATNQGWSASQSAPNCVNVRRGMTLMVYPVKLTAILTPAANLTTVRVDGRVGGLGPVQQRGLTEVMNLFQIDVVNIMISQRPAPAPPPASPSPASEPRSAVAHVEALERLADLHDRGVLTADEFAQEKARLLNQA